MPDRSNAAIANDLRKIAARRNAGRYVADAELLLEAARALRREHPVTDEPRMRYRLVPPKGATGGAEDAMKTWLVAGEDGSFVGKVVFDDFPDDFALAGAE